MSRVKIYDTYTEITNGLFVDIENEKSSITKNDIEEVLKSVVAETYRQITDMNSVVNMSEEEVIQYLDRISEQYEQHNNTI